MSTLTLLSELSELRALSRVRKGVYSSLVTYVAVLGRNGASDRKEAVIIVRFL